LHASRNRRLASLSVMFEYFFYMKATRQMPLILVEALALRFGRDQAQQGFTGFERQRATDLVMTTNFTKINSVLLVSLRASFILSPCINSVETLDGQARDIR